MKKLILPASILLNIMLLASVNSLKNSAAEARREPKVVTKTEYVTKEVEVPVYYEKEVDSGEHIIENDKVKIEYFDLDDGGFDILFTAKEDYNVLPVFTRTDDKFYRDAYFTGMQKNLAEIHVDNMNELSPELNWDFSWDNE